MTAALLEILHLLLWVTWVSWSFINTVALAVWLIDERAHMEKPWKVILWIIVSVAWLWYQCKKV